jgi:hypothetical protein
VAPSNSAPVTPEKRFLVRRRGTGHGHAHIKSKLESRELTTNQTGPVQQRLNACLAFDSDHITPRSPPGDHVKAIQDALGIIRGRRPDLGLPPITDAPGTYGDSTAAAVLIYKQKNSIVRPEQPLDNIVGRMTITKIDDDLVRGVKPTPPPPPPPIVGAAGVQIGPVGI